MSAADETQLAAESGRRAPTSLPPTSLIIPSRNRPDLLWQTIQSILGGEETPSEMIVVDQSDRRDTALATLTSDRCAIRYLWTQSRGVSRARNEAIAAAEHEILVFIDDDESVAPTWFGTLVRALIEAGPRSAVTGKVLATDFAGDDSFAPSLISDDVPVTYAGRIDKDVLYSNNMAMYRSAFDDIGDFDTRLGAGAIFPAATDNDCGFLLLEAGYRILYIPEATVYHRAWRREDDYLPLRWDYGVGRGAFYAKHMSWNDLFMARRLTADVARHIFPALKNPLHDPRRAAGDIALALGVIYGASKWLLTQTGRR